MLQMHISWTYLLHTMAWAYQYPTVVHTSHSCNYTTNISNSFTHIITLHQTLNKPWPKSAAHKPLHCPAMSPLTPAKVPYNISSSSSTNTRYNHNLIWPNLQPAKPVQRCQSNLLQATCSAKTFQPAAQVQIISHPTHFHLTVMQHPANLNWFSRSSIRNSTKLSHKSHVQTSYHLDSLINTSSNSGIQLTEKHFVTNWISN